MNTWVLLRGLTRESRHWGGFTAQLQEQLGAVDICAVDLPGNGRLNRQTSPTCIAGMTESCRSQLRTAGRQPPYHLLALSLGALVAVDWADRYPEEVVAGVLINTSLRPFSPWYQRLRPASYRALLRLLGERRPERREQAILELTSNQPLRPEILAAWTAYAGQHPVSRSNALHQLAAAIRYRAPATPPAAALLVLAGAGDRLVDPACSQTLARRWGAAFAEHPTAGHDLPLDDGAWIAGRIREWLATLSPRPAA